jgi:hypothetical protein
MRHKLYCFYVNHRCTCLIKNFLPDFFNSVSPFDPAYQCPLYIGECMYLCLSLSMGKLGTYNNNNNNIQQH